MANLKPLLLRDFRMGRITPDTLSNFLVPQNSVRDSLNVNFDEIVGSGKVRPGTTILGNSATFAPVGFTPTGIAEFVFPRTNVKTTSNLVINGTFTGSATGWTLGTGWAYGTNNVIHTPGNVEALSQDVGIIQDFQYTLNVDIGGTVGTVTVELGTGGQTNTVTAGTGSHMIAGLGGSDSLLRFIPSTDFNGTIDNVTLTMFYYRVLLAVFPDDAFTSTLYYYDGISWHTSDFNMSDATAKNRFSTLGGLEFVTNATTGMYTSPDGATWSTGAANDCIDAVSTSIYPTLLYRYKQRMLATGDFNLPDRVFFSSVVDPTSTPFITWNTDATTGDWIDINPDDGGNITGFSENSTFLLIFKDTGMYRMDTVSKTVDPDNIYNVGAVSQEAITLCQGVTYFFSGTGCYRTNGGYPELISRNGVQDIIDAMDPADWPNVSSGTDGFNVYFSLGQITFHKNQSNQRIVDNVWIKFSVRDQSWSVHSYRDFFFGFTQYTDENGQLMRGATDAGNVQTVNLGTTDGGNAVLDIAGNAIPFYLETQDLDWGDRSHLKGVSDKMAIFTDNGLASTLQARLDGSTLQNIITTLNQRVSVTTGINLQFNWLNFLWSGTSSGNPPILEGFYVETINDQGMGPAQGASQAPILPNVLR